jgi:hypothetical protein
LPLPAAALAPPLDTVGLTDRSAPTTAADASAALRHTRIVLHFRDHDRWGGTRVELTQTPSYWHSREKRVRHGRVSFRFRSWHTQGLSFAVRPRWVEGAIWAPYAVVRYRHTKVGQIITNAVAAKKRRASGCWAGTDRRRVDMIVRQRPFTAPDLTGEPGTWARVWMRRMRHNWPPFRRTFHGSIGSEDFLICKMP